MSFTKKDIKVTFQLGTDSFENGKNTKIVTGLACSFNIECIAMPDFNKCQGKIYNMNIDDIAKLTTLSFEPLSVEKRNLIKIETTDNGIDYSTAFIGEIENSFGDFNSSPDISLNINAIASSYAMKLPASPLSIKGSATVKNIMSKLAKAAGYKLECDITDTVNNVYIQGSVMQQIYFTAKAVNARVIVDNDVLIVLKNKEARKGKSVLINKDTGLIGYPVFSNQGVMFSCLYNKDLRQQGLVTLETIVPKAKGTWKIIKLQHALTANSPQGGDWKSTVEAVYI